MSLDDTGFQVVKLEELEEEELKVQYAVLMDL